MKKSLRLLSALSLAGVIFSCTDSKENNETPQLAAPVVVQNEIESGETYVAAMWSKVPDASEYNVVFDDKEMVTVSSTGMVWENLEKDSEHTVKVQAVSGDKTKYSDSEWSDAVVLKTISEKPSDSATYNVTFSGIDFYKAEAHVVPVCGKDYFFQVTPKVLFDKEYGEDYAQFASDFVAQVKEIGEGSGKTFGDMWLIFRYDGSKDADFTVNSLAPETEYIAIIFGVDIDGNITTPCTAATFKTIADPGFSKSEMTFNIDVNFETETLADVTVTPSVNDEYYFFAAINKNQLPGDTDEDIINYWLREFSKYLDDDSFESFASENLSKGKDSYAYNLENNSEYVVVAFGVKYHGDACVATTGLTKKAFHTGEISTDPTVQDIAININKLTSTDLAVTFVPSEPKKRYVWDVLAFDRFKGLTDDEIMSRIITERAQDGYFWLTVSTGNITTNKVNDLVAGTEYILLAFYVDEDPENAYVGKPASKLFKQIIVPPSAGGTTPGKPSLSFTIDPEEVTATSIKAAVTPSDASAKYISMLVEASKYAGKSDDEIIKGVIRDFGYDIYGSEKTGTTSLSSSKCKPETEYLAVAFGVDDSYNANSPLTKRTIKTASESVTPPSGEKTIAITVKECTANKISVDFKASDPAMELVTNIYKAEKFKDMADQEIISSVIKDFGYEIYYGLPVGSTNITRDAFTPDTEYIIVAFGVKNGNACTSLFKQTVKTPAN